MEITDWAIEHSVQVLELWSQNPRPSDNRRDLKVVTYLHCVPIFCVIKEENGRVYYIELLGGFDELMNVKHLEE